MKKTKLKKGDILSERRGIQCLIFDFDGTLAETEEPHRNAFNKAFNARKLNWHWDQHIDYPQRLRTNPSKINKTCKLFTKYLERI